MRRPVYSPAGRWKKGFVGWDYGWLIADGVGGHNIDARTLFFYDATVNTPAMAKKISAFGSKYTYSWCDTNGKLFRRRERRTK